VPSLDKLSVLIVSWNGRHHLEECLVPLLEQRRGAGAAVEVLVLDNGSTDGTVDWLARRFPEVRVVASASNLGFAAGNNRLAREASGDLLLLLNNDTCPDSHLLAAFVESWRSAPADVAALAGRLTDWDGLRLDFGRGIATFDGHAFALDQGRELREARLPRPGEELLFGCGGNLLVARRSFFEAGGFDESYFAYYEDVDLGWRLWAGGERILACPEASARHRQGATGTRLGDFRRGALFERNALLTVAKNFEDGLWEHMLPPVLLTFLARVEAMVATANSGGEVLRGDAAPPAREARGVRRRVARLLHAAAHRLASSRQPAQDLPRLEDPQTLAQLRGLSGCLAALDAAAGERRRLRARRRRPDREIFRRFPLWIVPTYPGDRALFGSAAFRDWLPEDLEFERAELADVLRGG
jgi:GT2 family glycosyltransferase